MKQTPRHLINYYRAPTPVVTRFTPGGARVVTDQKPTPHARIVRAVECLQIWTLLCGTVALFWYGFNFASAWTDNWFKDTEAAREAAVGKDIRAYEALWGDPVIGCHYEVPELRRYNLPTSIVFRGWINSPAELPPTNNQVGDFYKTQTNLWVWALDAGTLSPTWIDP